MSGDHVLAIDVGTQSCRAIVFDPHGNPVGFGRVAIEPPAVPVPGWAEHDPEMYWRKLGEACRLLWANDVVRRDSIGAVTLTTQRNTVIPTDAGGTALRPAIVWLDQRRTEDLPPIGGINGIAFRALGVRETVAQFQADCEASWIRANEPEVWGAIRHYLFLSGYLVHRLTGRFVDSYASQVGYVPFDYKRFRWAKPGDWKWQAAPIDPAWLPDLVAPTEPLGELTAAAAGVVGLPPGTPVIAAAADTACEVLGSGALDPWVGSIAYGTSSAINTTQRRYVEAIPLVPPYPAALPGAWSLESQVYRGFWMVEWFKREFGHAEVRRAEALGVAPEALFDELIRDTPPGSMGLVLQPFWSPGVRIPGPEAKGAIIGFGGVHTRAHLYRAIIEGLAFALREGGERAAKRAKQPLRELRVSGGGAQSAAAVQLTADVFGLPTSRPHTHEATALGAAIDAAVGIGVHPDVDAAAREMTRVAETLDPDPARHAVYDALYERVYRRMYDRLKPLYREIRDITGYPPR
ncbi:MAG: FGGY-family carbohydrate kinase [Chloroflexota bacterium]